MIGRYTLPEMAELWSDRSRFEHMLQVELAVLAVLAERGDLPPTAVAAIEVANGVPPTAPTSSAPRSVTRQT